MLKVTAAKADITEWDGDAIIVNLFKGVKQPGGATGAVDKALGGAIARLIGNGDLTGKLGQTALLYGNENIGAERVLVVGLGKQEEFDLDRVRRAAGKAVRALRSKRVRTAASIAHGAGIGGLDPQACARAVAEASISALYTFERKSNGDDEGEEDPEEKRLQELVVVERGDQLEAIERGVQRGSIVAGAQALARDIASFSGAEGTATHIAEFVRTTAKGTGLDCNVLGPTQIEREHMGGLLAVNRGSHEEPRFVQLTWEPEEYERTVCVVGKGVTFDTGGISLKRSSGMDKMRYDKSGAAATIGVLVAAAQLELPVRVIGLTPLTDNMPGANAIKPGDVITMRSGSTVEVINTDAEGRLILADALDYAKQFDPDHTVDMATLTGAVSVALGTQAVGLMSRDDELVEALREAGEQSHERVWPFPFYEEYEDQLDSDLADLQNVGGRKAGTITAGKFLEHFAPEKGWAHLDIAGTGWNSSKPYFNGDYYPKGVTGVGVRLLVTWLEGLSLSE